ncbi:MAG: YraN family protein [Pseudomonadota bacterium]
MSSRSALNLPMRDRRAAERRGRRSEWLASLSLQAKGYQILARRARTPAGEIDLIARRGHLVAFIEVKARRTPALALEAVTVTAQRRIARAAELWMAKHPDLAGLDWRFDIVAICPGRWPLHARDAFRPEHA